MGIKDGSSKGANELQDHDWEFPKEIRDSYENCQLHERTSFKGRRPHAFNRRDSGRNKPT